MHRAECSADGSSRAGTTRIPPGNGWSLLEVMAVVILTGVLARVALPHLQDHALRSRRADAWAALGALEMAQERHRNERGRYAASMAELGVSPVSPAGHYSLVVASSSGTGYRVLGMARDDSPQTRDADCACLALERRSGEVQHLSGPMPESLTLDLQRRCWPR